MRRLAISVVVAIITLGGCGDSDPLPDGLIGDGEVDLLDDAGEVDSVVDAAVDVGSEDAASDITTQDTIIDAPMDAPIDAALDAPADAGMDIEIDSAPDLGADIAGADIAIDIAVDVGADVAADIVAVDVGSDVGVDLAADLDPDTTDATVGLSLSDPHATPSRVRNTGESAVITVTVESTAAAVSEVTIDLSQLGLSATQPMNDSGTDGDQTASDGIYSCTAVVADTVSLGDYTLTISASDILANSATDTAALTVQGARTLSLLTADSGAGNTPEGRAMAGVAYDPQGDRMLIYAGRLDLLAGAGYGGTDDLWEYTFDTKKPWSEIKPASPNGAPYARFGATAFVDLPRYRLITGGGSLYDVGVSDAWYTDLTPGAESWVQIAQFFDFLGGEALAHDAANDRVVLVGTWMCAFGIGTGSGPPDVRQVELDTDTAPSLTVSGTPPPFSCALGVDDPVNHRMVLIGGSALWQMSLTAGSETWAPITAGGGTPPSFDPTAAAVRTTSNGHVQMYVLGTTWNEIWRLDLTTPGAETWTQLPLTGTPPVDQRTYFGLINDASRNRLVIFGGESLPAGVQTLHNDVWEIAYIDD